MPGEEWGPVLSPAFGAYGVTACVNDGEHKVIRATANTRSDADRAWRRGDPMLLDLGRSEVPFQDTSADHPEIVRRMAGQLDAWIEADGFPSLDGPDLGP